MSDTFLQEILQITRNKVEGQKRTVDVSQLRSAALEYRSSSEKHRFCNALSLRDGVNIIAEIKRASPSKGVINDQIDVAELAEAYVKGGARAISVLTEETFFLGSLEDLRLVKETVDIPVLRKDFIVDEFQIFEAADAGADATLLIVAALDRKDLKVFFEVAEDELDMDTLVEVHTLEEMLVAIDIGAKIIGINNRDLHTFEVSLDVSRQLIRHRPADILMIAESGISSAEDIAELSSLGFDGFLIGESLMRGHDLAVFSGAAI